MSWSLKRTRQCAKCPWRKDVNPLDIPDGYTEEKHRALASTIAKEDDYSFLNKKTLLIMACHETGDAHCVGWLVNQMGPGNNLALRMHMRDCANDHRIRTVGAQHETFEDTIP